MPACSGQSGHRSSFPAGRKLVVQAGMSVEVVRDQRNTLVSNGKQSGPRIGMQKGPLNGVGTGLSR
jgi:hypothetical protein